MLSRRLLRDSRQLRESYIEISNYFRGQSRVSSRPRFQCNRLCPSPPRFSTSAAKAKLKSIEHDLQETGGDVTKGFPDLPNPDELPKLVVNVDTPQNKGLGHEVGDGVSDRRIPLETRQFLAEYKRRRTSHLDNPEFKSLHKLQTISLKMPTPGIFWNFSETRQLPRRTEKFQ